MIVTLYNLFGLFDHGSSLTHLFYVDLSLEIQVRFLDQACTQEK